MRLKRSRLRQYYHRKKTVKKDKEGGTSEEFDPALPFCAEVWPAGGKLQCEIYGERLPYIRNVRIDGGYRIQSDARGILHYVGGDLDLVEGDGVCLYVPGDSEPDYRIIAIRAYRFLKLEVEKRR